MDPERDPRNAVAKRGLALSWTFFTLFLATVLGLAAVGGQEPLLFGLPRWVALACFAAPALFVAILVPAVERLLPDIPLGDDEDRAP